MCLFVHCLVDGNENRRGHLLKFMLLLVEDLLLAISLEDQMLLLNLARNEVAIPICKSPNVCVCVAKSFSINLFEFDMFLSACRNFRPCFFFVSQEFQEINIQINSVFHQQWRRLFCLSYVIESELCSKLEAFHNLINEYGFIINR